MRPGQRQAIGTRVHSSYGTFYRLLQPIEFGRMLLGERTPALGVIRDWTKRL